MVAPMAEGMDRISAALGIPHMDSNSSASLGTVLQIVADINRWVLAILTMPVGAVDRRDTLHATVSSLTCGVVVAMIVVTIVVPIFEACKATIPLISNPDSSTLPVGIAARVATTLTLAIIHPFICRMDPVGMEQWRIGADFVGKTRICQLTAQPSCHHMISCIHSCLRRRCRTDSNNEEIWLVCRIQVRCRVWRLA